MDVTTKALYVVIDIVLPLVAGYLCKRLAWLGETTVSRMITANLLVMYPLLLIISFWGTRLSPELTLLPVLGVLMMVIAGLMAYPRARAKYKSGLDQGSYMMSAILSNTVTFGGLMAFFLYGERGYAYAQLINLFSNVMLFLVCFPLAQYYFERGSSEASTISLKSLLLNRNQLPTLGLFFGAWLSYAGIPRPALAAMVFDPLVHVAAWTLILPVGYSADLSEMRKYWRNLLDLNVIKFVATPLLIYLIARPLFADPVVLNTVVVVAAMPVALTSVIAVRVHHLNIHLAMAAFILTTVVFLLLVCPLLFLLFAA